MCFARSKGVLKTLFRQGLVRVVPLPLLPLCSDKVPLVLSLGLPGTIRLSAAVKAFCSGAASVDTPGAEWCPSGDPEEVFSLSSQSPLSVSETRLEEADEARRGLGFCVTFIQN